MQEIPMDVKPSIMEGEFSGNQDEHVKIIACCNFLQLLDLSC